MIDHVAVKKDTLGTLTPYGDTPENSAFFFHFAGAYHVHYPNVDAFISIAKAHGCGVYEIREEEPKVKILSVKPSKEGK